jgi:hypothetical protein
MVLRNVGILSQHYMTSQPRRPRLEILFSSQPQTQQLSGSHRLVFSGYRESFPKGKAAEDPPSRICGAILPHLP